MDEFKAAVVGHFVGEQLGGFEVVQLVNRANRFGFLVAERSPIPPSRPFIQAFFAQTPVRNETYRPRGAAALA